ncbi:MAG: hypothetical protein KKH22_06345 [Proteobacteria bacterium]|nr:hypothetical protein [Pseudomonadota bacterium]
MDFEWYSNKKSSPSGVSFIGSEIGYTREISYPYGFNPPLSTLSQSTGTSQISIDEYSERIDLIRRVASLEKKIDRIEGFFGISLSSINTLGNKKWEVKQPLNVSIEQRLTDEFIACLYDVDLYGYGETIPEALEDLKTVIVNQYDYLLEQECKIGFGSFLKKQMDFFKKFLVKANA